MDFPRCKGKGHLRESGIGAWVNSCTEGNPHFWEGREGKGGWGGFPQEKTIRETVRETSAACTCFGGGQKENKVTPRRGYYQLYGRANWNLA